MMDNRVTRDPEASDEHNEIDPSQSVHEVIELLEDITRRELALIQARGVVNVYRAPIKLEHTSLVLEGHSGGLGRDADYFLSCEHVDDGTLSHPWFSKNHHIRDGVWHVNRVDAAEQF